ncbi:MAG: hypothetical protein H6883_11685 [Rhodobiaceae bacterium]|nr:hypothetical protein [Rhodobiaceae bacterium]MCC0056786.1 hypothetical protein [Rhodobiaceae bacterium]
MTLSLADERCGLYFLAGLDQAASAGQPDVLTIHTAAGTLGDDHLLFIKDAVADIDAALVVDVRFHSPKDLYAPESLESFARLFKHDHVVADPTGAFTRAPELLALAASLRTELGDTVERVLWRAQDASLVLVLATHAVATDFAGALHVPEKLRSQIAVLVDELAGAGLRHAIAKVQAVAAAPAGRYVCIDQKSVLPRRSVQPVKAAGIMARLAGALALIGLGTMAAAAATTPGVEEDAQAPTPGITALVGLTSLGENAFGVRNQYQAVGGLRLYFGDTGILLASAFVGGGSGGIDHLLDLNDNGESKPIRLAYGGLVTPA